MKYSVSNLLKRKNECIKFEEILDYEDIASTVKDLRKITKVDVNGELSIRNKLAYVKMKIAGEMTLICAISNEDVKYPFDIEVEEVFNLSADKLHDDEINEPVNKTVDLIPYVWQAIVVEVPIKIVKDGVDTSMSGDGWNLISEEKYVDLSNSEEKEIDPRLKKLLDFQCEE
jgi:uncharacterized protein